MLATRLKVESGFPIQIPDETGIPDRALSFSA
jgi:hypothetical protein